MSSSLVRINAKTFKILNEIVRSTGETKQEVLSKAIEEYRRNQFIREANEAYSVLKRNANQWQEEIDERNEWDVSLEDGLGDE